MSEHKTSKTCLPRRSFIARLSLGATSLFTLPLAALAEKVKAGMNTPTNQLMDPIKKISPMGFQWETADPFLFCVHHEDFFPKGNAEMEPTTSLSGRHLGDDFIIKDGFRMYHGKRVPGFPGHPHRGFETITVVRKGLVDHADSMGAAGRYGNGDVQWMTAGKGVQHSEMFPLIYEDKENPMELFQIWLNLPKKNKMVEPHFKMLWSETIPHYQHSDNQGAKTTVEVIAGKLGDKKAPAPPPDSWAADPANEVAVWNIKMEPGAQWLLPKTAAGVNRTIYFYQGETLKAGNQILSSYQCANIHPEAEMVLQNGSSEAKILLLQGKPINEHVIQYGPFVMNTKEEIHQAFDDYHKTQFGGWPWPRYDQVHPRSKGRFALHADGKEETKQG
jgi:redox-sensitive bicupin YhaK (pirin superfamily)